MTPETFFSTYINAALQNERVNGVPHLFTLAQSALETGWGKNTPGNMMFGVKATGGWTGAKQLLRTTEYLRTPTFKFPVILAITGPDARGLYKYDVKDWFRAYPSPYDSFADHAKMLRASKNFAPAFAHANDAREFAKAIAAGGYATAPNYAASLLALLTMLESIERKVKAFEYALPERPPAAAPAPKTETTSRPPLFLRILKRVFHV